MSVECDGVFDIQESLESMEDDARHISDFIPSSQRQYPDPYYLNYLPQTAGASSKPPRSETSFPSMVSGSPLSLTCDLLPSEIPPSSQSLAHPFAPVYETETWDIEMDQSNLLNPNFTGYQGQGNAAGLYACNTGDITSEMGVGGWPEPFQNYADLGQYSHWDSLLECPSAYNSDASAPPNASAQPITPRTFDLSSQTPTSTIPRPSLEPPSSAPGVYPPLSPPDSMASGAPTSSAMQLCSPENAAKSVPEAGNVGSEDDTDADSASSEEPYARLIFKALMSVPGHRMALKDIYDWFENHTNKTKNSDTKGWQNSIRHNLSMNAAFEGGKEAPSSGAGPRKGANVWILTEQAIKNGVQSTTRYRKQGNSKKSQKSDHPAPQRQRSGAKGGRAAKKSARHRRVAQDSPKAEHALLATGITSHSHSGLAANYTTTMAEFHQPLSTATPRFAADTLEGYGFGIIGCANFSMGTPLFYHDDRDDHNARGTEFPMATDPAVGPNFNHLY